MTFSNPDDERDASSLPRRFVAGPVVISLALHGAVLLGLTRMAMREADGSDSVRPSISVALVTPARQRAPVPAPAPAPQELQEPDPSRLDVPPEPEDSEADVRIAEPERAAAPALPPDSDEETAPADPRSSGRQAVDEADNQPWTPARIRAALDSSRRDQQSETTVGWLTDCIVEQKRLGTRDCKQQQQALDYASDSKRAGRAAAEAAFVVVTGPERRARLSEEFRRENSRLAELMDDGGVVGGLATQRYYINLEYFRYLNGNGQDPMFSAMQNFSADVLGGSALSLPGNVPFTCSRWRTGYAIGEKRKATGVPMPCIYEWTGFRIERPETDEADAFRVVPVVPRNNAAGNAIQVKP